MATARVGNLIMRVTPQDTDQSPHIGRITAVATNANAYRLLGAPGDRQGDAFPNAVTGIADADLASEFYDIDFDATTPPGSIGVMTIPGFGTRFVWVVRSWRLFVPASARNPYTGVVSSSEQTVELVYAEFLSRSKSAGSDPILKLNGARILFTPTVANFSLGVAGVGVPYAAV